uniref:Peptidase aspartic putative domain-containing protein n=1 Tax=Plectus sambesii TaxID=2011161 RepID=A0A914X5A1_9BILA
MLNASNTSMALFALILVAYFVREGHCEEAEAVKLEADPNEDVAGFFDMEMGKDRSLKSFYYQGGYLSIYEGRNEKLKRYYVTPLTEINIESAKCFEPGVESRHKVQFDIEIWRSEVADEAVKALASPPLNLEVRAENVHPLPILKIRLSTHGLSSAYEPDTVWKWNLDQRLQHAFSIYAANKEACERMVSEIKENPVRFASLIQIEIAMSAEKRASREISITGENIGKSRMFAQLQNMDQTNGERLLTSSDLNNLAQEIVSSVVASDITTGAYVDKPDQVNFASLLEHQISSGTIDSKQLSADQWKSVFWQEEFIRPDHYTNYLNHALTYEKGTNKFSFDNGTEFAARKHVASDLKKDSSSSDSWKAEAKAGFLGGLFGGSAGYFYLQIGRERAVLIRYIEQANKRDYKLKKEEPHLISAIRQKREEAMIDRGKLRASAERLQHYIERLAKIIYELRFEKETQKEEQKKFDEIVNSDSGASKLIGKAYETIDMLDENIIGFENAERERQVKSEMLVQPVDALGYQQQAQLLALNHPLSTQRSTAQLPRLELCTFDGTITEWQQFWETFKVSVHDEPLPPIQKMSYLMSALRGEAKMMATGYAVTEANYPVLVARLKQLFGNQDRIIEKLRKELRDLPKASEQIADAHRVVHQIERICRQLEALGESTEERQMGVEIQSKMPKWIMRSVYQEREKDSQWTVQKLREHIEKILRLEEIVAEAHKEVNEGKRTPAAENKVSTGTFAVNGQRFQRTPRCAFCQGEHWHDQCHVVATREMRLKKVADYNMCPRCLGAGHNASQCNYKRPCFFCRENHNSALCPGKTQRQGPQSNGGQMRGGNERPMMRNQAQRSNGAATKKVMAVSYNEISELEPDEEGPVLQVNAALYQKEDDGESSKDKESPKKEVLLLSKEVTLGNPKEPERQLKAIAFFDVGSQLSFITEDVAKKLQLVPSGQEKIAISTFAAKKPTELQSLGYKIDLKHAEGTIKMR